MGISGLSDYPLGLCVCGGAFVPRSRGESGLICEQCGWTAADLEVAVRGSNDEIIWMPVAELLDAYR